MEVRGSRRIAARREAVWAALSDPEVLRRSIPGCTSVTGNVSEGFEATVSQKVGPIGASFTGRLTLAEMHPPEACTIIGEGTGGAAGLASGSAAVNLAEAEGGTLLSYVVTAQVDGKLAKLGTRVIAGFASRLAEGFFDRFRAAVEPQPNGPAVAEERAPWSRAGWLGRLTRGKG